MAQPTQLAYRTVKAIGVFNASPVYQQLPGFVRPEGNLRCCCYSPDGKFFAWASPEQVSVIDATVGHVITTLPAANVYELGFSPYGTYIITWQRPAKDEEGNAVKNLKVWKTIDDLATAGGERSVVGQFVQRSQTGWNLQYTVDEKYCARVVTNEVQFYQSDNLQRVWNKLYAEGVTDFAVSPGKNHSVAIFVPERKGQPAAIKLYTVPNFNAPVSQKTFYKGDKVSMKWNDQGTGVLILAQTDVDKSNKNYYGESTMFLLTTNGFDSRIALDKDGPIHDVAWSPNSKEFGVVYGYMPAKTTIFNNRADATHSFALGPRNTIAFSPHGRFVLVAGFGNLAGQVDIYDLSKNYAKVCTIEASNASIYDWSPDGTHIMFATTSPRLRVDNGIRLFHVGGGLMYNEDIEELYHVCWRPQTTTTHPLPPDPLNPISVPHESAKAALARIKAPSKPAGAYRPPGARGTSTPLHFKREDEGGTFVPNAGNTLTGLSGPNGFGKNRRREVPGAEPNEPQLPPGAAPGGGVSIEGEEGMSKAALKNKKKREAKKAKDAADREKNLNPAGGSQGAMDGVPKGPRVVSRSPERRGHHQRNRSGYDHANAQGRSPQRQNHGGRGNRQGQNHVAANGTNAGPSIAPPPGLIDTSSQGPAPDLTVTSPGGGGPNEKKIRSLLKKLRAIEDLKMRQAGGEKLEATQVSKIASEDSVRKELDALGPY